MSFDARVRYSDGRHILGITLLIVVGLARAASADLVVVSNRSSAQVTAAIFLGTDQLALSTSSSPRGSTAGTFVWSDSVSSSALGATSTAAADIRTSISSSRISGAGSTTTTVSAEGSAGGTAATSSGAQLNLMLTSPHAFSYVATFVVESAPGSYPGLTLHAVAGLTLIDDILGSREVFSDELARLGGPTSSGTHTIAHSGLLAPGLYVLSGGLASIFHHSTFESPNSRGGVAFDFVFDVTPASPVPEPATLTLLGAALAGIVARARVKTVKRRR